MWDNNLLGCCWHLAHEMSPHVLVTCFMGASEVVNLKRQEIFLSILEWTTIIPGLIEIYVYFLFDKICQYLDQQFDKTNNWHAFTLPKTWSRKCRLSDVRFMSAKKCKISTTKMTMTWCLSIEYMIVVLPCKA